MKNKHNHKLWVVMVVAMFLFMLAVMPVSAKNLDVTANSIIQNYVADEVIIKFKDSTDEKSKARVKIQKSLSKKKNLSLINGELVKITNGKNVQDVINELNLDPNVEYAQPNYLYQAHAITNDTYAGLLWGLNNTGQVVNNKVGVADIDIDVPEAWTITQGNDSTIVAVIDTGVDISHTDLAANIWTNTGEVAGDGIDNDGNGYVDDVHGWDFFNNDSSLYDAVDGDDHGTHTSGTIAALANNGLGIVGVAPNVKIMPLKFIGPNGGYTSDAIEALAYAKNKGAMLASNSWGGGPYDTALYNAIVSFGKPFIASAGNSSNNTDTKPEYPAAYDCANIISVAAVDNKGNLASFSNYGAISVDIAAPGVDVASTTPNGTYSYMSGTSMAAPHVAGVAALLVSLNPNLTTAEVKDFILRSIDPLASLTGKTVTGGMVNAYKAAVLATGGTIQPPADTTGPALVSTDPVNKATNVATTKLITITFNEEIAAADFSLVTIKKSKTSVAFTGAISGRTITLKPNSNLFLGSTYTVTIGAKAVKDSAGNPNTTTKTFSFTTARK